MSKFAKLGDVADLSIGFVGTVTTQYEEDGVPFLRTLNISPYKIDVSDVKRMKHSFHEKQKKSQLKIGDIAMVHTGVPGICCTISEDIGECNCIDMIVIKPKKGKSDSNYLEAYMNTIGYKHIEKLQVGCVQKHFNLKDAQELQVYLPDIIIQERIGQIIKAINSKIENNNKINAELESMAKTIYDYWFLQFEFPNEEGKSYKSSGGKMVWNEVLKREIPEEWNPGTLSDISKITMGTSPKGDTLNQDKVGTVFYQGKTDFGDRFPSVRMYTSKPIRFAEVNDVLLSVRAPVGAINMANENCCIGRGLAAISSEYSSFLYYLLLSNQFQFNKYNNNGTTFGAINKEELNNLPVLIPNKTVMKQYDEKVKIFDDIIKNNYNENQELTSLRDFLLPMLINGQVGFKEK